MHTTSIYRLIGKCSSGRHLNSIAVALTQSISSGPWLRHVEYCGHSRANKCNTSGASTQTRHSFVQRSLSASIARRQRVSCQSAAHTPNQPLQRGLYIVGTPIGNLEDISLRAIRVLRDASCVLAEDTRHTRKLLTHYEIHNRLVSVHSHNEASRTQQVSISNFSILQLFTLSIKGRKVT